MARQLKYQENSHKINLEVKNMKVKSTKLRRRWSNIVKGNLKRNLIYPMDKRGEWRIMTRLKTIYFLMKSFQRIPKGCKD